MKYGINWMINDLVRVSTHAKRQTVAIYAAILVIVLRTIPTVDLGKEFDESNPYM